MNTSYTKKSQEIVFHENWVQSDLYRYLKKEDILVLLNRLPLEEYEHLKSVTFKTCRGRNVYGKVYHKRSAGIIICDQSARTSVRVKEAKRGSIEEFGALNNIKWPTLAIRRFMLYDVFLHELKHTQLLRNSKKRIVDKIPLEKQAEEYAEYWRGELYQHHFDHPDPVHNLPSEIEKERLKKYWTKAIDFLQKGMRLRDRKEIRSALLNYEEAIEYMQLYHGDLTIENEDISKIQWKVNQLTSQQFHVNLGIVSDSKKYEQIHDLLIKNSQVNVIGEYTQSTVFRMTAFELQSESFSFQLEWKKNGELTIGFMLFSEKIDENILTLYDELIASIKQELKLNNEEN